MFGSIKSIVSMAYTLLATLYPAVGRIPLHPLLSAIDVVQTALALELKADWRIHDREAFGRMVAEVGEATRNPTPEETREAMYAVLVYITNIEEYMTLEEFMDMDLPE